MPSDFTVIRYSRPKLKPHVYQSLMTYASRTLGFSDSDTAQFRLHCIDVHQQLGWVGLSAAFPQLKRATFYRWRKDYLGSGKRLSKLVPTSTAPTRRRTPMVAPVVVMELQRLRCEYPRLGKMKLKPLLDEFCLEQGLPVVSATTIGRTITRKHLFYTGKARYSHQSQRVRRLKCCPRADSLLAGYIQLDGVRIYDLDQYLYFLTAIDVVTKQVWVRPVPTFSSKHTAVFVQDIISGSPHPVHSIQTDNGSEFAGEFEQALVTLGVTHLRSRPRRPQTNGYIERFNWTLKDEFLFSHEEYFHDRNKLQSKLEEWLIFYHTKRVHQSLGYQTPHHYATTKGVAVS